LRHWLISVPISPMSISTLIKFNPQTLIKSTPQMRVSAALTFDTLRQRTESFGEKLNYNKCRSARTLAGVLPAALRVGC